MVTTPTFIKSLCNNGRGFQRKSQDVVPLLAVSASGLPNVASNSNDPEKETYIFIEEGNYLNDKKRSI